MVFDFKDIHIGACIKERCESLGISMIRVCNFLNITDDEVYEMFMQKSLDTEVLLRWSKLLEYDFFRIYTQHIIIFAPQANMGYNTVSPKKDSSLPQFRKNVYTKEVIDFVLELISTGQKTKQQVIEEYKIPKTTLYKWASKYDRS